MLHREKDALFTLVAETFMVAHKAGHEQRGVTRAEYDYLNNLLNDYIAERCQTADERKAADYAVETAIALSSVRI